MLEWESLWAQVVKVIDGRVSSPVLLLLHVLLDVRGVRPGVVLHGGVGQDLLHLDVLHDAVGHLQGLQDAIALQAVAEDLLVKLERGQPGDLDLELEGGDSNGLWMDQLPPLLQHTN